MEQLEISHVTLLYTVSLAVTLSHRLELYPAEPLPVGTGWHVCKCLGEGEKLPDNDGSRDFHSNPAWDECITHNGDGWVQRVEEIGTSVGIYQLENKME